MYQNCFLPHSTSETFYNMEGELSPSASATTVLLFLLFRLPNFNSITFMYFIFVPKLLILLIFICRIYNIWIYNYLYSLFEHNSN